MSEQMIYSIAGNVLAAGGFYIRRKADEELLKFCREHEFSYVLAPRQVGKSSLVAFTANQLASEEILTVIIDLNQIGVSVEREEWYLGQLVIIQDKLNLRTNVFEWWRNQPRVGFSLRMINFYRTVLLKEITHQVIIFIDEIEATRSLNFTDDFYAAIRSIYNARATEPDFKRLSFVLIGSATPNDLIQNPKSTPFNIAHAIEITDFTLDETRPLADGFGLPADESEELLRHIHAWTGGHPYLTQRLCRAVVDENRASWTEADVKAVVAKTFFGENSGKDNNLLVVRDMLTRGAADRRAVLTTYKNIYKRSPVVRDEENSPVKEYLKLSGVVHREGTLLRVRNLIYRKVFNGRWVEKCLESTG